MRLATLIAAHNEAGIVEETLRRCRSALPADMEIILLADRCTDNTAALGRAAGVTVVERPDGAPGKAPALAWFLETARADQDRWNALLILDADSQPEPGAAEALGAALEAGATAAQGFVRSIPDLGSAASLWASYSEWISQAFRDRLRAAWGWPVPLRGTGMAVRLDALRDLLPQLRSSVEDAELTLLLLERRKDIRFVPEAVFGDPKPATVRGAARQRARWISGQASLVIWHPGLILRLLLTRGPAVTTLVLSLLARPKTLAWVLKAAVIATLLPWRRHLAAQVAIVTLSASLLLQVAVIVCGIPFAPKAWRGRLALTLFLAPIFLLVWGWALILGCLSKEPWLRART